MWCSREHGAGGQLRRGRTTPFPYDDISTSGLTVKLLEQSTLAIVTAMSIVDQMRKRVIELENGHVVRDESRGVYGYQH